MYSEKYYKNHIDKDRPALWFYARLARRFFSDGKILDYGCGYGHLVKRLKKHFVANGMDISEGARVEAAKLVGNAEFFSSTERIESSAYSGIVSLHVIEHISDKDIGILLEEWKRILIPKGKVICVTPDKGGRGNQLKGSDWAGFKDPTHINLKSYKDWVKVFEKAGFLVKKIGSDGLWDFPYKDKLPKTIDAFLHSKNTVLQFVLGHLILSPGRGESAIFLLIKK